MVVSTLCDALARYLERGDGSAAELRPALAVFAREARARELPPERLLAALQDAWEGVIRRVGTRHPGDERRIRERLITICMEQYLALGAALVLARVVTAAAS